MSKISLGNFWFCLVPLLPVGNFPKFYHVINYDGFPKYKKILRFSPKTMGGEPPFTPKSSFLGGQQACEPVKLQLLCGTECLHYWKAMTPFGKRDILLRLTRGSFKITVLLLLSPPTPLLSGRSLALPQLVILLFLLYLFPLQIKSENYK